MVGLSNLAAIGNVEAFAVISIRSQVTGVLEQLSFHEGDLVKQGQLLFTIDRRPFEAALAQAEAMMVRDKAERLAGDEKLRHAYLGF